MPLTELDIIRNRIRELQDANNDIVQVLGKKPSASSVSRLVADLETRIVSLEERIESIESRLTALEEED